MFYTVYKITNKINDKYYIGCHQTKDVDDDYMGSGVYLKAAQAKYGIENFTKEILYIFDNAEEMFAKEAALVTLDEVKNPNSYNIKEGGFGGWQAINSDSDRQRAKCILSNERQKELRETDPEWVKKQEEKLNKKDRRTISENYTGLNNSQYETFWVCKDSVVKKISKAELQKYVDTGWLNGRVNFEEKLAAEEREKNAGCITSKKKLRLVN
jgi:hypothetical protein